MWRAVAIAAASRGDRGLTSAPLSADDEFAILRVGERYDRHFQDLGVEYYGYVRA